MLSLLEDNYWIPPKKIEIKLNEWLSKEKHRSKIDVLPTLEQIQNFVKHQRIKNDSILKNSKSFVKIKTGLGLRLDQKYKHT